MAFRTNDPPKVSPALTTPETRCAKSLSSVQLFVTLWMVAHQVPLSVGFSRQEHWSGLSCPLPQDLPGPGIEPAPLISPALTGGLFTSKATWDELTKSNPGAQSLVSTPYTLTYPSGWVLGGNHFIKWTELESIKIPWLKHESYRALHYISHFFKCLNHL